MTTRTQAAEEVAQVAAGAGAPEIQPIAQKDVDDALKEVDRRVGQAFAAVVEQNFKHRDALIEAQGERTRKAIATLHHYGELTKGQPAMGALMEACIKAGRENRKAGATSGMAGGADGVATALEKSLGAEVAKSINLADGAEGGILVEGTVLELWLEPLRAASVVLSLEPEVIPVTGDQLKVTGFETDPGVVWVDEENTSPLSTTPATGLRQTAMRKAMSLIPVTADFRENANPQVLRRLEDLMRAAFQVGFDQEYITADGLSNRITGLRTHISESSPSAGQTLTNVLTDAEAAINSVETNNVPVLRFGILMAPRSKNHLMFGALNADNEPFFMTEMRGGTFLGWPFRVTTSIPTNLGGGSNESYIIWQAMNQFFVGTSTGLDLEWFRTASYTEGGSLVSTIERDTEVLRARQKTATLMPHRTSGYVTTQVLYGT